MIRQGDLYWIDLGEPSGSRPGYRHPHVVIQNDLFNASRIGTVVVCALTSNLTRADAPDNLRLHKGEGCLPKECVVNVSQVFTVDKADCVEKIGTLSGRQIREIIGGLRIMIEPRVIRDPGYRTVLARFTVAAGVSLPPLHLFTVAASPPLRRPRPRGRRPLSSSLRPSPSPAAPTPLRSG